MPIKIIADSRTELPEHLQGEAKEVDGGKFEVSADGIIKKNKELLGKNASLQTRAEEAEAAKEAAEASAKEWKGKANIPAGQKLVSDEVAELGEAAKTAEIGKDEMPTLKTAKADLQKQIDDAANEKTIAEVAKATGRDVESLKEHVAAKGLKFETKEETVDGKNVVKFIAVRQDGDAEVKTDATEYFEKTASHVKLAESEQSGFQYPRQKPDNQSNSKVPAAQATINSRYGKTIATLTKQQ